MLWLDAVSPMQKAGEETVFFDSDPTKRIGESRERERERVPVLHTH